MKFWMIVSARAMVLARLIFWPTLSDALLLPAWLISPDFTLLITHRMRANVG
jgi:hypothetical protein